ncbi:MAG: PEP-CTERM sorting domain-containing protein, partial [Halioglobus sp.]|nr:PEP-CTERM sorting domain-containing protein [Halioglobus sp.]
MKAGEIHPSKVLSPVNCASWLSEKFTLSRKVTGASRFNRLMHIGNHNFGVEFASPCNNNKALMWSDKMMKRIFAVLMLSVFAATANATLIGDTVGCSITNFWDCDSPTAVVGDPGAEFILADVISPGGPFVDFSVDIGANSIAINGIGSLITVNAPNSLILTLDDLDWVGMPAAEIIGIDNLVTTVSGIDLSDITFTAHSVSIELGQGASSWVSGNSLSFDLVKGVPSPATIALFGLGLAGIGWSR